MDLIEPSELPNEVLEKIKALELELSEGDITEKGFIKKKSQILQLFTKDRKVLITKTNSQIPRVGVHIPSDPSMIELRPDVNNGVQSGHKKDGRRYTRDESRYRSDVREEAVREALSRSRGQEALVPSKRKEPPLPSNSHEPEANNSATSGYMRVVNRLQEQDSDTEDDDDITNASSDGSNKDRPKLAEAPPAVVHAAPHKSRREAAAVAISSCSSNIPRPKPRNKINVISKDIDASASRHARLQSGAHGAPPDVTASHTPSPSMTTGASTTSSTVVATVPSHTGSMSSLQTGSGTVGPLENGLVSSRVSEKIQQLVQTLKRPKRRPLPEYFQEDDDNLAVPVPTEDPNAPKPKGTVIEPSIGEPVNAPQPSCRMHHNLEAALSAYAQSHAKMPMMTCIDSNGRVQGAALTYAKLHQRATRIAYLLLNKLGHRGEHSLKPRDRVALVFANNDPTNFVCAFYGCLLASVVPLSIEVPLVRRDASCQSMGFLLSSQEIRIVLTSEQCYKSLPRGVSGEIELFSGWPRVQWINIDHHTTVGRDWQPPDRLPDNETLYVEYSYARDGGVRAVAVNRQSTLEHCKALSSVCRYTEGETLICVSELRRETGLWHAVLTAVYSGLQVVYVPYAVLKADPAVWLKAASRLRAASAVVKSRDMHWALLAEREYNALSLGSLRVVLVADGSNPWSLSTCDNFLAAMRPRGLAAEALCPCAGSSETGTVSLRRPGARDPLDTLVEGHTSSGGAGGRGVLSMHSLSYGLVRVDSENSLTSLTLQDCGQLLPSGKAVVVRPSGPPLLCHTDEVGEICLQAPHTANGYWGLQGQTNQFFKVQPLDPVSGAPLEPPGGAGYVRSGLLGFLGPAKSGGLLFICGSMQGLISVGGRRHNSDDLIATVLAVEPMKIVFRGRIAVFSVPLLRDERIVVVAELRQGYSEEAAFKWMSRVLQAVDSIHQVALYCIVLVPHNYLPKTPLGGIHIHDTKRRFLEGRLSACNVLLCPHGAVTNLPQPREVRQGQVGPSAMMVGQMVQGTRMAGAQGRDVPLEIENKTIAQILLERANNTPQSRLFSQVGPRMQEIAGLTCSQLQRKAERIAYILQKKAAMKSSVVLLYPPGTELICAFYACLLCGALPVPVKAPLVAGGSTGGTSGSGTTLSSLGSTTLGSLAGAEGVHSTLDAARQVMRACGSVCVLTCAAVLKVLRSRDAAQRVPLSEWHTLIDTDDIPKKRLPAHDFHTPLSLDEPAYIDFSWSPQGVPIGVRQTHSALLHICQAQKLQCEFYPSREVVLCLDPYSGLGLTLWCLSGVYCGHLSHLVPPGLLESQADLWLATCSVKQVRDTFCSYTVLESSTKHLANSIPQLKLRNVSLSCLRSLVVVAEERPRLQSTSNFCKLFSVLGLNTRAVSTSFGCRVSVAMCLQGASSPDSSSVFVDQVSLRNDRVKLLEKGSPHSLCLLESGKLLPGVRIAIAHPETLGQCADSHLGEIWVSSTLNSAHLIPAGDGAGRQLTMRLATGDTEAVYARTGFLGFVRRTELTQSDGERHDAVFVVGALEDTIVLRGNRHHPSDIEATVSRCHKSKIADCAVFTWSNLLVVVVELCGQDWEAVDLVPLVTAAVLEEHLLVVGVVVVVDRGTVLVNSRGEKERVLLRDLFVNDKLDPMYVSYNM